MGGYSGVGLHAKKEMFPEKPHFFHPSFDNENRIVAVQLGAIKIASIYVPNGGKDFPAKMRFLQELNQYVEAEHALGSQLILCGDMNVARSDRDVHPKERRPNSIGQRPEERALIESMVAHGVVDVGRSLDPDNDQMFTWWAPWRNMRERNIGWRLDYVLASTALASTAVACPVQKDVGTSDHAPVMATFELV